MINVIVVEDNKGIRESLRDMLNAADGFHCSAVFEDGKTAVNEIASYEPDVILMDINLPGLNGVECTRKLKAELPTVQIVMQTVYDDSKSIFESLKAGATGYLLKRTPFPKILEAITEVHNGGSPISSAIARMVIESFHQKSDAGINSLTVREKELLELLTEGYRYKEIAEKLFISIDTVRSHIRKIYEKLQVTSRTEAVMKYVNR